MPVVLPQGALGSRDLLDEQEFEGAGSSPTSSRYWPGTLPPPPPGATFAPVEQPKAGMDELISAAWENDLLNGQISDDKAMGRAYNDFIFKARQAGLNIDWSPYNPGTAFIEREGLTNRIGRWHDQVNQQLENNPDLAAKIAPITREAVASWANELSREAKARLIDVKERRGEGFWSLDTLAEFGVGMGASLTDPVQFATAPIGGSSKTVLGAVVRGAIENAAIDAAMEPFIQSRQLEIGNLKDWQEAVAEGVNGILLSGAVGGTVSGGVKGGEVAYSSLPSVKRTEMLKGWTREIESMGFDSAKVQQHVLRMMGEQVQNEGQMPITHSLAEAFREAAGRATPDAAARLSEMADQVDQEVERQKQQDVSREKARDAMRVLSQITEETDPDAAAIIRKAEAEAEKEYSTARQMPEGIEPDEFVDKIEEADAHIRRLQEFMDRPDPRRPDPPEGRLDTSDDAPTPRVGDRLTEDGKPVTFTSFDPRQLGVAPDEMQYKRYSGQEGVNGAIADVEQWHAPSSGKILVFERKDGTLVVADGHQRRSKALGIMQAQGRDDIKLDGYLYREADGWTAADMRLKGAQKNIREGRSDVLDTAQALRERPDAIDSSFPLSRSNIRQAQQIARLSDDAWDLTRAGVLEPQYAALIGQVARDRPDIHGPLARTLVEAAPDNVRQAENILSEALLDYAERDASMQPSLFGDDNLGRAVMYKERAQIMDAAYSWLRSERSVFKALVDKGDIARALGNQLVDAVNITAKDQVDLAIAAIMHSRKAGVRTAITDMISRALDSVRREGVTPARAGQQVAREIRTLVEERGFRALLDAEGPAPPQVSEAGPLFDGPGSKAHEEQADMLEGDLHPEGIEDPGVKLADALKAPDEVTSLVDELKGAGQGGGDRTPDQILKEIRTLIAPNKDGKAKKVDPEKEAEAEFQRFQKADAQLRDMLDGLTDEQKLALVKMQYPDAYPYMNRLYGPYLDEAIVGRVMQGEVKWARQGDILVLSQDQRVFSPGQPDNLGFITSAERALAQPPARFRDAKALTAEQWRKLMREGGASKEAFTYQIEPALKELADAGLDGDIPKTKFEEALAKNRTTLKVNTEKGDPIEGVLGEDPSVNHDYSPYIASGKATNYRQQVIYLPGLDYHSHNWSTPGAVGHKRTTDRITADGEKTHHVEELQSDIHQEGAKYGYKGEAVPAALRKQESIASQNAQRSAQATAALDAAFTRYKQWFEGLDAVAKKTVPPAEYGRVPTVGEAAEIEDAVGREFAREWARADQRLANLIDDIIEMEAQAHWEYAPDIPSPPRAPMENWEEPFVRLALLDAAKDGIDLVTFPTWATLHRALQNEGTKKFYDQRLPNTLARVAKSLGLKVEMVELRIGAGKTEGSGPAKYRIGRELTEDGRNGYVVQFKDRDTGREWGNASKVFATKTKAEAWLVAKTDATAAVPGIRLTPEAKAKLGQGVVMYSRGGAWTSGMSAEGVVSRLKTEFGDGSTALMRIGEVNIADKPPIWAAPDTQGLTDARGRVTLYAANMAPDDVRGLVLHEVGVHAGLDGILGVAGKQRLLDDIAGRMMAAAPDHALWRAMGGERAAPSAPAFRFEPLGKMAATDLADMAPDDWASAIRENNYAAYRLPGEAVEGQLPSNYVVVRQGEEFFAVRQDHLKQREAAGAVVTELSGDKSILAAMNRVPLDTRPEHIVEETLAYLVQHAPKHPFVQRLISDIRAWIYKTFPKMQEWMTLTDSDLVSLAMGAVRQRIREADRPVTYGRTKGGGAFSTSGVRYARRPRNETGNPPQNRGTEVSGGAGQPGRGDVRGGAGAGKAAAGSGNASASAGPARAVVTEQIPPLPPSGRRRWWNEQLELNPEQRAERKQQFRDFVNAQEFDVEQTRGHGDFKFKNGKRTGERGAYEHLVYTLRKPDQMHDSWQSAMDPEISRLEIEIHGSEVTVPYSRLADDFQSTGLGTKMYAKMIDDMLARGLTVNSDVSVSKGAIALWQSLRNKGYDVIRRVPEGAGEWGADKQFSSRDNMTAVFFVSRKKPPAPDLPFSDRDLSNKINEARDLNEHIPKCIKGK